MSTDPRFKIRKTKTGLGLFAVVPIKKGSFVLEYTGKMLKTEYADTLNTKYLFDLETGWTVDGSPRSNLARYINHSCDENTEASIEGSHILIHAVKNIKVGDELTIDYGEEYFDEFIKPHGCKCGSPKCRSKAAAKKAKKKVVAKK